jgi:SRSO17 transposase
MRGDLGTERRFGTYLEKIGKILRTDRQREHFATYAVGVLSDCERKSCEPIAALGATSPQDAQQRHDNLLYFIRETVWDDRAVRLCAAREAIEALEKRGGVAAWVIDDTGFPKQGKNSVGVQRQYSGTLGKIGNCQIGVSLSVATEHEHVPIDFELYLPTGWAEDEARRRASRIPDEVGFATKIELAIEMMDRALKNEIPGDVVLADAAYGSSGPFREYVLSIGKHFACGIQGDCLLHLLTPQGRRHGEPRKASDIASEVGRKAFRRITYRNGSKGKMASCFCLRRVKVAGGEPSEARNTPLWLVMEWPEGEERPTKLALTSLGASLSKREIVRVLKERWHTEQAYAELKGELGLDHFEGRSFPAWHHHITVVLSCYAFLVAERSRRFPPSEEATEGNEDRGEAGAALRGLPRIDAPHPRARRHAMARGLSAMPPPSRDRRRRVRAMSVRDRAPAVVLGRCGRR